jgi:hypothetical protein
MKARHIVGKTVAEVRQERRKMLYGMETVLYSIKFTDGSVVVFVAVDSETGGEVTARYMGGDAKVRQ